MAKSQGEEAAATLLFAESRKLSQTLRALSDALYDNPVLLTDSRQRVTATKVFADFAQIPATKSHTYEEAGPDGLILRPGYLVVAEYGEGRVHVFTREGVWRTTLKVSMPFVDTVAFDGAGNLWAGGSFQNTRPPFEGAVVRFPQSEWEQPAR